MARRHVRGSLGASPRAIRGPSGCRPPRARRATRPTAATRRSRGRTADRPASRPRYWSSASAAITARLSSEVRTCSGRCRCGSRGCRCCGSRAAARPAARGSRQSRSAETRMPSPAASTRPPAISGARPRATRSAAEKLIRTTWNIADQRLGLAVAEAVFFVGRLRGDPHAGERREAARPGRARCRRGCRASRSSRCATPPRPSSATRNSAIAIEA